MSGEQQLERSVLENKERDELHAIADAMGLKPGARTKKADLVDNILRATGVDVGDPESNGSGPSGEAAAKPRRGRTTRARASEPAGTEVTTQPDGDGDRSERDLQGQGQDVQFQGEPVAVQGFLDLRDEGFGFLRTSGFLPSPRDIYVSISQVRRFALRKGDYVEGASRPASSNEKYPALLRIDNVSGLTPDEARQRPRFEDLTPLFPDSKMRLEVPGDAANVTARIVDLVAPIRS